MLTQMPNSYHTREDIHDPCDIDEVSFESHISDIANPDVIASGDFNGLKSVDPGRHLPERPRGLTDTFDRHREVRRFHQTGNASISDSVSHTQ